jgi:argininosuccinate synthase
VIECLKSYWPIQEAWIHLYAYRSLKERYGFDKVVTVLVDVGQPKEDIERGQKRAKQLADEYYIIDARKEFVDGYIFPLIKANGSYEGYVLGTAIARPLIASKAAEIARKLSIKNLAHGCTGRGNDQLRFEAIFRATDCRVIAPMRELDLAREWEIEYARDHGIDVPVTKEKPWSIDENIWSRSIEGGKLEDPYFEPPEEIYGWTKTPNAGKPAQVVEVGFEKGVPVSLDGAEMEGMDLIAKLNEIGGEHGVGRTDMVEDRVLGLKARENYEHPAATILLTAHKDLEHLVLSRAELRFKATVDDAWSELAYMGLLDDPLYSDLNAFIDQSQKGQRLSQGKALCRMRHPCRTKVSGCVIRPGYGLLRFTDLKPARCGRLCQVSWLPGTASKEKVRLKIGCRIFRSGFSIFS